MKRGRTPLAIAAKFAKSPAVVEALLNGKADLEATAKVRHLEDKSMCPVCAH